MSNRTMLLPIYFLLSFGIVIAQPNKQVKQMAYADSLRLVEIFKDLHQNPELGFMEVRTSGIVARELKSLGYEVIAGIAKTGVAGILKNGDGPVVMYRADMDCNSVKEITGLPYASTKTMKKEDGTEVPVMHACGHDAHITWMLGIAKIMTDERKNWKGTLVFIAQPAEEPMLGAEAMVADKMYEKGVPVPDYLFGLHTWPIPVGTIYNGSWRTYGRQRPVGRYLLWYRRPWIITAIDKRSHSNGKHGSDAISNYYQPEYCRAGCGRSDGRRIPGRH